MAALHLAPSPSSVGPAEQKSVHRPSPYMRRVRLPRLDFGIRENGQPHHSCHLPYFMDNDLPSPEELMAKIELIQLKNKQISGHHNSTQKRPNGNVDLNGNKMGKRNNIGERDEEKRKKSISICSSKTNSVGGNKCAKNQQNIKTPKKEENEGKNGNKKKKGGGEKSTQPIENGKINKIK